MFNLFSGGRQAPNSWPLDEVLQAIRNRFGAAQLVGEDGPIKVYGVEDNGVNFVIALMQSAPGTQEIVEIGFLARFVGFPVDVHLVENLNRNLHISVASFEEGDLFLMAGLQIIGPYSETQFNLVIEQWRRDLAICIHSISSEQSSLAQAFPAAKLEAARSFAANHAPAPPKEGAPEPRSDADMLSVFLGAGRARQRICGACGGRGKRGLIARTCSVCNGTGFVMADG